jgi:hypothetical protein
VTNAVLGTRLTREYRQTLEASHEQVFPLLCPEREKQWLPRWEARWIHCASGVAEPRVVFATQHDAQPEVIWVVAEHRPAHRVHRCAGIRKRWLYSANNFVRLGSPPCRLRTEWCGTMNACLPSPGSHLV